MDDNDNNGGAATSNNDSAPSLTELPFLVTHWLQNYQGPEDEGDEEREEAIERLRNATSDMAVAFSSLGAYGTSSRPSFRALDMQPASHNATYGDMVRRWQPVPPNQLESLVQAAASVTRASESVASRASTNLLLAAQETQADAGGGRRLTDGPQLATAVPTSTSILQAPALIGPSKESDSQIVAKPKNDELPLAIESDSNRLGQAASKAMREYLSLRQEHEQADVDINKLNKEVTKQQVLKGRLEKERASILASGNEAASEHASRLNQIAEGLLNTDRLIPQHTNNLSKLEESQRSRSEKLSQAKEVSQSLYSKLSTTMKQFRDPTDGQKATSSIPVRIPCCVPRENSSFFDTITRQYGAGGSWGSRLPKRIHGATPSDKAAAETRKSILAKRLTYSMTASAHLAFPVFCLCFDKTGRYFVTGADDCLVKVFYIGAARSNATTQRTFSYGSNDRSAVLVCTLRGHAGVICDIDISADNAFLATASDDGDCRVWGLKDGSPIAILRGHKDGANMVSWSELTPYRLVTSSSDGLARMWDIREAAINRYGAHVSKRADYKLPLSNTGRSTSDGSESVSRSGASSAALASGAELLPPLPVRNGGSVGGNADNGDAVDENAVGAGGNAAAGAAGVGNVQPGQFVRNDMLDEGVRLVTKLQHGAPPDESGAATRSRRKAVKVICIARCPRGGHFATGAEDGICRVWSEEDGDAIAKQDAKHTSDLFQSGQRVVARRSGRVQQQTEGRLLAELTGHVNSITDLHYSHNGDRLLSASQKDGVTRVWSWTESAVDGGEARFENVKQILLQVKKPESMVSNGGPSRRRAGASNNASCDVAVWTADDARIVTSQCCNVKEGSPEIVEGSQYILVWDSRNGQCLLGISNAHDAQVPVLIPHPMIPTVLCSAGGDGIAKLWDLEKGQCTHLHENKILDIGPVPESNEQQRKYSGYLDGSFSPDGLSLVLTDDSGRFTMFSIEDNNSNGSGNAASSSLCRSSSSNQRISSWMKEQYFANDYYELYFDTNGYCVERGSGQPPHLAPRSVRCSFTGSAWAEEVNDTYSRLVGPLPLSEYAVRRSRSEIRYQTFLSESEDRPENNRANLVSYFDPLRTVLIDGKTNSVITASALASASESARQASRAAGRGNQTQSQARRGSPNGRTLSSNYRWRGYEDIIAEEAAREEEEDVADDDYAPNARAVEDDEDLSDDISMTDSSNEDSPRVTRRSSRNRSNRNRRRRRTRDQTLSFEERSRARPTRVSARQLNRTQPEHYEEESDSDGYVDEFLSTNNTPSGPHSEDYTSTGHYFKLPDSGRVRRQWLLRTENNTSHVGNKNYAPQVGDSVVYIPRAHYETIKIFPTLDAPWKHFERGAKWPIVRCSVKDIRYRFPYEQYYRSQNEARCLSIVAILTLEVTGIPALSSDEETVLPWPKPSFVEKRTRGHLFEVSMFESDFPEFVIPEALFSWRLQSIENASHPTRRQNELPVVAYFSQEETTRSRTRSVEDQEMVAYSGTLTNRRRNSEPLPDGHLRDSGYGTLEVDWDEGGESMILSPWELTLRDKAYETPSPPTLSETATRAIANAIAKIEALPLVEQYFLHPVDERRYPDYRNRVEVPMNYSFIKERLAAGYYSNVRSVLSDAKLISDNCFKYNGPGDLSQSASDIYDSFVDEVKSHVDIDETPVRAPVPSVAPGASLNGDSSRASRVARRQPRRASGRSSRPGSSEDGVTSLERLPMPDQRASSTRTTRRGAAQSSRSRARGGPQPVSSRATRSRSGRSVLAMGREDDSESGDEYIDDQNQNGDGDSAKESSESMSDDDSEPRRTSLRISRNSGQSGTSLRISRSSRQSGTRRSTRTTSGNANAAAISSKEEWEEQQNQSSSEEEQEEDGEESSASSPTPTRRSRRLLTPDSHQEETRVSPGRPTRASRRSTQASSMTYENLDSPRRSTRAHERSSLADLSHSDVDEEEAEAGESENESSEEEEMEAKATRRGRSSLKRRSDDAPARLTAGKRRKTSSTRSSSARSSLRRTSGRSTKGSRATRSYADPSDSEVDGDQASSSENEEPPKKPARAASVAKRASPRRTSGRSTKGSRATRSYADPSDSEGDGDQASSSENEEPPKRPARAASVAKRARGESPETRTAKRTRRKSNGDAEGFPELKEWPEIDIKAITEVSKGVLNQFSILDEGGLFATPVVEQVPQLRDDYLAQIKYPMDFRTIEDDKIPAYHEIRQLQDDLILVFRNCATFNEAGSQLHALAITMWEQLNDVFRNVCEEQNVMLPRRW